MVTTTEHQLGKAIQLFLKERNLKLATGPMDEVELPIEGGEFLKVPALFLVPASAHPRAGNSGGSVNRGLSQ